MRSDSFSRNQNDLNQAMLEEFHFQDFFDEQAELRSGKKRKKVKLPTSQNSKALFEDARRTSRLQKISVLISRCMMAFALLCMALSLTAKEIEIGESTSKIVLEKKVLKRNKNNSLYVSVLNLMVSVLMAIINILNKVLSHKLSIMRLEKKDDEPFLTKKMLIRLIFQTVLYSMSPLPFLNGLKFSSLNSFVGQGVEYMYNDFFHIFQFVKLYPVIKAYIVSSDFSSSGSYRICGLYGFKHRNTFVIKCMMRETPMRFILSMFLFGIVFFGYALRIAEAPLIKVNKAIDLTDFFNCCWTAMLTMTTVGYGDFYPRTSMGRLIMFVCCIYGMIVTSLMVTFVSQELLLSAGEAKAFAIINRLDIKKRMSKKATEIVSKCGRYLSYKSQGPRMANQAKKTMEEISYKNKDIRALSNKYKTCYEPNDEEQSDGNFQVMINDLKELKIKMVKINEGVGRWNKEHARKG